MIADWLLATRLDFTANGSTRTFGPKARVAGTITFALLDETAKE